MDLLYKSGNELVLYSIDRVNKKLRVANSQTEYKLIDWDYEELFKPNDYDQTILDADDINELSDEMFEKYISKAMAKVGYERTELPK